MRYKVKGRFNADWNNLKDLKGSPYYIGDYFVCANSNLISLEGSPVYVGGMFGVTANKIESIKGMPQFIGGSFYMKNQSTKHKFIEDEIRSMSDIKGYVHL